MKKLNTTKKILILIPVILLLIFAVVNAVWFYYRHAYFVQFIKHHPEFELNHDFDDEENSPLYQEYVYRDPALHGENVKYRYGLYYPRKYLSFSGNYSLTQTPVIDTDDDGRILNKYAISITIFPSVTGKFQYRTEIQDFSNENQTVYCMDLDPQMNLIHDLGGNSSIILDKANAEIREAMDSARSVFGLS